MHSPERKQGSDEKTNNSTGFSYPENPLRSILLQNQRIGVVRWVLLVSALIFMGEYQFFKLPLHSPEKKGEKEGGRVGRMRKLVIPLDSATLKTPFGQPLPPILKSSQEISQNQSFAKRGGGATTTAKIAASCFCARPTKRRFHPFLLQLSTPPYFTRFRPN